MILSIDYSNMFYIFTKYLKLKIMKSNFFIGGIVKYKNPQPSEEQQRFYVNEIHEPDGNLKEKLHVELICEDAIKPTFCFFSDEFEPTYISKKVMYMGKEIDCESFGRLV